jgi:Domain of unknown function (DUF4157)
MNIQAGGIKTGLTVQGNTAARRASVAGGVLRRKCACGGTSGLAGECAECGKKRLLPQRMAVQGVETGAAPSLTPAALRAPGLPIESEAGQFRMSRGGYNIGQIPIAPPATRPNGLQIGSPLDPQEQEADRVADNVMQMRPEDDTDLPIHQDAAPLTVRRTTYSPYSLDEGRIIEEDEEDEEEQIQAKSAAGPAPSAVSDKVEAVVRRPGAALPDATRALMESRFGYDFSRVRIHADALADEAAESVNARAFTKGASLVFARGQYSPYSQSGRWLLAHELAHVVQQGNATARAGFDSPRGGVSESVPTISRHDRSQTLRRVKWNTARDTGRDSYPWVTGPKGDVYEVETNAGTKIPAWKPHDGSTYWCHGYTFSGSSAARGPFSIWGQSVPTVLKDDGWQNEPSCVAQQGSILVFAQNNVAHSGIINSVSAPGSVVDENASMLDSKWGQAAQNVSSWTTNVAQYGRYKVFSKQPNFGPCRGNGPNEG